MRYCQCCHLWFEPRVMVADLVRAQFPPKKRWGASTRVQERGICLRCEAFLTLCSLKSEALCEAQRALPFPLFPARRRRSGVKHDDASTVRPSATDDGEQRRPARMG